MASARKRKNFIACMENDQKLIYDQDQTKTLFLEHYKCILGCLEEPCISANWDQLYAHNPDLSALERPFTMEEIKQAIMSLASDKVPDLDGFPGLFYQKYQDIIKEDLFLLFSDLYHHPVGLGRINHSFLTLVLKKKECKKVKDYDPINLIHQVPKIFSKLLSLRLTDYMDSLTSEIQSAFIKGKQIMDGFLSISKLIARSKQTKFKSLLLKIDFENAFDSMDQSFLLTLLRSRGFEYR